MNRIFALIVILLTWENSLTSYSSSENKCLCELYKLNCFTKINGDFMTYSYSFQDGNQTWFHKQGVVQCWNNDFIPKKLQIANCTPHQYFRMYFDFQMKFFENPHESSKMSLCITETRKEEVNSSKILQWMPKYTSHNVLDLILRMLSSPKYLTNLVIEDITNIINENILYNLTYIEKISLKNTKLKNIPIQLLRNAQNLTSLFIINNEIQEILPETFIFQHKLNILNLTHNQIRILGSCNYNSARNFLNPLQNLLYIDFSYNNISRICYNFFGHNLNLKLINLQFNKITTINGVFVNTENNIRILNLSHNKLEKISETDFKLLTKLINLDLSSNHISIIDQLAFNHLEKLTQISLENNFLHFKDNSAPYFPNVNLLLSLSNNFLENIPQSQPNSLICEDKHYCPVLCSCLKMNEAVWMNCVYKDYISISIKFPFNAQFLNSDFNNITYLENLNHSNWDKFLSLSIRHDQVNSFSNEHLPFESNQITFDSNKLKQPSGWLEYFPGNNSSPSYLHLSNNLWSCDCNNILFQNWINNFAKTEWISAGWNMKCVNGNLLLNFNMCSLSQVQIWQILLPISIVLFFALLSVLLVLFYYLKKSTILAWILSKRICLCCVNEDELDADKEYDAFLSYSHQDGAFIRDFLTELENNEPYYKICVHERDWPPGELILDQIVKSVKNSRRTIIVLSENFTKSVWANFEFKCANYQSIIDKVNRVIVVVLNENFSSDDLDDEFFAHLSFTPYIKVNDSQFWNKLRYAMPRKKNIKIKMQQVGENEDTAEM